MRPERERGIRSLEPMGVFEGRVANYLVTRYIGDLASMNQVGWEQSSNPAIMQGFHVPLIRQMGKFLRKIHEGHLVHGDLQLKNFARRRSGEFVLIDLEKAERTESMSVVEIQRKRAYDLMRVTSSLLQKHFLSHFERDKAEITANHYLLGSYRAG